MKQFLLNPDGSIPANVNVDLLIEEGIKFVLPTPAPIVPGMIAIEQEPQLVDDFWVQVWKLEPIPEENTDAVYE